MNTLVDFRSKYLGFDRPLYLRYHQADFPRHYSTFDRWFDAGWPNKQCNRSPEHYPIKFPIKYEDIYLGPDTFREMPNNNTWVLVLFVLLFLVVWTKRR